MLLFELMSTDSIVDWFAESMSSTYAKAYDVASKTYESTDNLKLAKMHGGAMLGKWYATYVINVNGPSLPQLLKSLKPHNIQLPEILGTHAQKEAEQYSSSRNLQTLIHELIPLLHKRRFSKAADSLYAATTSYAQKMSVLGQEDDEDDVPPAKVKNPTVDAQHSAAQQMVMSTIAQLPRDIQATVRQQVSRKGNTMQALRDVLKANNIQM